MRKTVKIQKNGKLRVIRQCDFIIGCVFEDYARPKPIMCCDVPVGEPMPKGMRELTTIDLGL